MLPRGRGWMVNRGMLLCRWQDPDPVAEDGLKNGHLELLEWGLEVWQKGLYIAVGPILPPHLYLLSE